MTVAMDVVLSQCFTITVMEFALNVTEADIQNTNKPRLKYMRKLIDLDEATFEALSILAIKNKTNLKSYIESVLVTHAGGGFKDKKPSTKRKLKN